MRTKITATFNISARHPTAVSKEESETASASYRRCVYRSQVSAGPGLAALLRAIARPANCPAAVFYRHPCLRVEDVGLKY